LSHERVKAAFKGEMPDVIPLYLTINHPDFVRDATGVDPYEHPLISSRRLIERFDIDLGSFPLSDEPQKPPTERQQDDTVQTEDGGYRSRYSPETQWYLKTPFKSVEEVLNFDTDPFGKDSEKALYPNYALKNYRWLYEDWTERIKQENETVRKVGEVYNDRLTCGAGFYTTLFMWPIMIFGWELFLEAGGLYPDQMGALLGRFAEITRKYCEFVSLTDQEFFSPHDDIAIASGPVFNPKWYRKYIFPRYEYIFEPVKKSGKPIIFISDGNYTEFLDDLAAVTDGFLFEPLTDLEQAVRKWGKKKVIIGNVDSRILRSGKKEEIFKEVKRCTDLGRDCPGYFISCTNHITYEIPLENVYAYFDACEKLRKR